VSDTQAIRAPEVIGKEPAATRRRAAGPRRLVLGIAGLLILLAAWWVVAFAFSSAGSGLAALFAPQPAFASLYQMLTEADLLTHILLSLQRVLVGLSLALLIGVPVGLVVGLNRTVEAATSPSFQFLRMISPLSWMPIAVMLFGVGDQPIYFLLTFAAVWPILLNTAAGVRQLEPSWLLLSRSLAATRWETLVHVVIPGVVSHVLTGARLSIGILWILLVPCEMLGVSAGLGYVILDTRDRLAYSELMAMVILIGFLGFLLDSAARELHRRWAPTAAG
jgi:NitT/TauT family transport system permease protein